MIEVLDCYDPEEYIRQGYNKRCEEEREWQQTIVETAKEAFREELMDIASWDIEDTMKAFDNWGTLKQILEHFSAKEISRKRGEIELRHYLESRFGKRCAGV